MAATPTDVALEQFHREGYARAVVATARVCGRDEAEACVQEAFVRALRVWPAAGVPADPSAWLRRVARRVAIDHLRSRRKLSDAEVETVYLAASADDDSPPEGAPDDETLRQLLACAVPEMPPVTRAMLMLKEVCGLSVPQVAAVFRVTTPAAAQRLVRAKRELTAAQFSAELSGADVRARAPAVADTVYLVFSAGFHEADAEPAEAMELVDEALRLGRLLARSAAGTPAAGAMLAAMLLQAARLGARRDASGRLLSLAEQDRSRWDARRIDEGLAWLARSAEGAELTEYHLHAGIAACHAMAASHAETDWGQILSQYDALLAISPTPVTRLARCVALGHARGAATALPEATALLDDPALRDDFRTYALLGELFARSGRGTEAARSYRKAASLAARPAEREWLERRATNGA